MSWTNGTWADVAIGDTVLGGDGYPWEVTDEEPRYAPNGDEYVNVTIEREGRAPARSTVRASKPVKYRKAEPVTKTCPGCSNLMPAGHKFPYCSPCIDEAEGESTSKLGPRHLWDTVSSDPWPIASKVAPADAEPVTDAGEATEPTYTVAETCEAWGGCDEHPAPAAPKVAPYVEYDDAERAAASALKGAGLTMTVIERVMTLDGLIEHLTEVHGEDLPDGWTVLTRIEYRSRLADLHFELHAHDQERGRKWAPRGRTPHVHPVMDRPMEDATPKSLRRR